MPGEPGAPAKMPEPEAPGRRLDSWKEIAGYLNRHVTTVRRWERLEGLPVHRHLHSRLGTIYAYAPELDAWIQSRRREEDLVAELQVPPRGASGVRAAAARAPTALPPPPSLAAFAAMAPLCGRVEELGGLERAWEAARGRQRQLVLMSGDAGAGKTRLTMEFARAVAREASVLVGQCDREAVVPFAPLVTILRWILRATAPQQLRQRLAQVEGVNELVHVLPEIASRIPSGQADVQATPEGHRYRMFEACSELLNLTTQDAPVLLVVEDVHWADHGTLLFLRHLVRSTAGASLCIVLTYRDHDPERSDGAQEILEDLPREPGAHRLALGPLAEDDVRRLIASRIDEAPAWLTAFALTQAEGNPLFLVELLQHLDESGAITRLDHMPVTIDVADVGLPGGVRALVARRFERLAETTRKLLTVAAVIGREFRLSLLERVVTAGEEALLDAMDEAIAARLVAEDPSAPGTFSFTHPLIREALYFAATGARRIRLHHRVAEALEQEGPQGDVGSLAYHFGQAAAYRGAGKALEYAVGAAERASAGLAFEDAARFYDMAVRAVDLLPEEEGSAWKRAELLTRRGRCFFGVGQWAGAKAAFENALGLLDPADERGRCELLVNLAEASFWLMDVASLRRHAAEGEALAQRIGREDLWADALAWMASADVSDGDVMGGLQTDRRVLERVGAIRSFGLARVPLTLYWAGCVHEAADRASDAVAHARASGDPSFLLYALQHLGLSLSGAGRYDESVRAFDEARAFGRRCGALPLLARATSMSVAPLLGLGDFAGAEARAWEARELAHRVAFEPPLVSAGIDLLLAFARMQEPGRAEPLLAETARAVQKAGGWHAWKWNMRLSQAEAELALARGDCRIAVEHAARVIEQSRARHRVKYEALALATRAEAGRRLGLREAVADARAAADVARTLGDPAVQLECLLVLLETDGDDEVLEEARGVAGRITAALPPGSLAAEFSRWVARRAPAVLGA